jgi:protein-disulfide isomerase
VERQLIDEYVSTGQARFVYKHYIVIDDNIGGRESLDAALASECAAEQGEFWNYHTMLFANQSGEGRGAYAVRRLKAFAEALQLDTAAFNTCLDSRRHTNVVQSEEQEGVSRGVTGTPTVFVNGIQIQNPLDYSEFQRVIEAQLAAQP